MGPLAAYFIGGGILPAELRQQLPGIFFGLCRHTPHNQIPIRAGEEWRASQMEAKFHMVLNPLILSGCGNHSHQDRDKKHHLGPRQEEDQQSSENQQKGTKGDTQKERQPTHSIWPPEQPY